MLIRNEKSVSIFHLSLKTLCYVQKPSQVFFLGEILLFESLVWVIKPAVNHMDKNESLVDFLQIRPEVVQWIEQAQPQLRALLKTAAEHLAGKESVGRLPALITRTSLEAQLQHALGTCVLCGEKRRPHANNTRCSLWLSVFFALFVCLLQLCLRPVQISSLYSESGTIWEKAPRAASSSRTSTLPHVID